MPIRTICSVSEFNSSKEDESAATSDSDQDSSAISDRTKDEVEPITKLGADLPSPDNEQVLYAHLHCPTILHGEPLTDRKSTFQAHAAAVTAVQEVSCMIQLD